MLQPFRLTPVHDRLLRSVSELHLVTAEQLTRLHYSAKSLTYVKATLKSLTDHGYVFSDSVPTKRYRSPYYYALSPKGARYLLATGLDVPFSKDADRHALFIRHTLELNDVLISALLLSKIAPIRLDHFLHERTLKRSPIRVDGHSLIPDAFLDFRNSEDRRRPILLEHDRGTEGERHFKRKVRSYASLLTSGAYQERFQVKTMLVAVTTFVGQVRALQLSQWTRAETDLNRFWFASLTAPPDPSIWLEPVWLQPHNTQPQALLG